MARNLHNNDLVKGGGIYFIFLTNPDGAEIVLDGIESLPCNITKMYLTAANNGSNNNKRMCFFIEYFFQKQSLPSTLLYTFLYSPTISSTVKSFSYMVFDALDILS